MGHSIEYCSAYVWIEAKKLILHSERFKVLREMHEVRKFHLVLCADIFGYIVKDSMAMLKRIVEAEKARGGIELSSVRTINNFRGEGTSLSPP